MNQRLESEQKNPQLWLLAAAVYHSECKPFSLYSVQYLQDSSIYSSFHL